MDTLSDFPGPPGEGQVFTLPSNRPGLNMADMAPLGPSQIDIGNLAHCRCSEMRGNAWSQYLDFLVASRNIQRDIRAVWALPGGALPRLLFSTTGIQLDITSDHMCLSIYLIILSEPKILVQGAAEDPDQRLPGAQRGQDRPGQEEP